MRSAGGAGHTGGERAEGGDPTAGERDGGGAGVRRAAADVATGGVTEHRATDGAHGRLGRLPHRRRAGLRRGPPLHPIAFSSPRTLCETALRRRHRHTMGPFTTIRDESFWAGRSPFSEF